MSALLNRNIEVSHNAIALRRSWRPSTGAEKPNRSRYASWQPRQRGRRAFAQFDAGLLRAAEFTVSTIFIGIFFALSVAFTALMLTAILITLACGLACYG